MQAVTVNSVAVSRSISCPDTRQEGMIIEPSKPSDGNAPTQIYSPAAVYSVIMRWANLS